MVRFLIAPVVSAALALTGLVVGTAPAHSAEATGSIAVQVRTQDDQVIRQSYVDLYGLDSDKTASVVSVGSGGWSRHTGIAPGSYRLVIRDRIGTEAERTALVDLAAGESVRVTMRITAAQTISGRVTLGSKPVASVAVTARSAFGKGYLNSASTKTDSDGRYALVVTPGTFVLRVKKGVVGQVATKTTYSGGVTSESAATRFTVEPGSHVTENVPAVRVVPAAKITGRVVDSAGRPVRGVLVYGRAIMGRNQARWRTDADGRFTLGVKGLGAYELSFRGADLWEYTTTVKTAKVRKGKTISVGKVTLASPAQSGTSTLAVNFSGPLAQFSYMTPVYLKDSRGNYLREQQIWEDPGASEAVFRRLAAGAYEVYVVANRQSFKVTVGTGETVTRNFTLELPAKAGNVTIKIGRHLTDKDFLHAELWNSSNVRIARANGLKFFDVGTGTYTLRLVASKREYVRKITVRAGRTTTVVINPAGGQVAGRIKAGGKGYPGTVILKGVGTSARYERKAKDSGRFVLGEIAPGRYRVIVRDAPRMGATFTVGGFRDAYYQGKTLKKSRVITVKKRKTTRLATISFR